MSEANAGVETSVVKGKITARTLQRELDARNIKYAKSAKKEDLIKLLDLADGLVAGEADPGSMLNAGGVLSVACTVETFWQGLGHWRMIGRLSQVAKSFKSLLGSNMAWRQVASTMHHVSKRELCLVLALPISQCSNGLPLENLERALTLHGSAQNMYLARHKKYEQSKKAMLRPKKPRQPRRKMYFNHGCGNCPDCILRGPGWFPQRLFMDDDDYNHSGDDDSDSDGGEVGCSIM